MLKQRVITALILSALVLAALFLLPFSWFALAVAAAFGIAAWEWSNFAALRGALRYGYVVLLVLSMGLCWYWIGFGQVLAVGLAERTSVIMLIAALWWLLAIFFVATFPSSAQRWARPVLQALMGVLVLVPAWLALVFLRSQPHGEWLIVMMVVTVVCADTGAYFVGRRWGKKKLAPAVSPGKSMEGLYGGMASSAVFALILVFTISGGSPNFWLLAVILPTSVVSVFGDLLESMMKRQRGIKDSGTLLPGHGGILDRFDSITAAAPIFALAYLITPWRL